MTAKLNQILAVVAAALFLLSMLSYRESVERAERFERGQKFLPNLNPDEIAEIEIMKGEASTHLKRSDDHFVVVGAGGYPAKNEAVNRFIRDVLDLSLESEVGKGDTLAQELGLAGEVAGETTTAAENTTVAFKDATGKAMVRFVVSDGAAEDDPGDGGEGQSGSFIRRTDIDDGPIYLTSTRVWLTTGDDSFLDQDLLDVPQAEIAAIHGPDYDFVKEGEDGLKLENLPPGKKESPKASQVKSILTGLRFVEHHLANAPEVQGLALSPIVDIDLADDSGYRLSYAEAGGKHYLKLQGYHKTEQLAIARDAGEEEVRQTADVLQRIDEMQQFNNFHGSWIYEVSASVADKLKLQKADLIENA